MYKKITIAIFLLSYACFIFAQKNYTIQFNEKDFSFSKNDFGEMRIETNGNYYYLPDTLLPALPYTNVRILIPPCTEIDEFEFTYKTKIVLENVTIEHNPQIFATNDSDIEKYQYSPVKYNGSVFPDNILHFEGVYSLGGIYFASFNICPFIYSSKNKELQIISSCNISITTKEASISKYNGYKNIHLGTISNMVINWDEFTSMYNENIKASLPINNIDSLDYVIITSDDLADSFKPLINWKIKKGLKAEILTLSDINHLYPAIQNDIPLQIKTALYDLYRTRNLKWVLLGGNTNLIPSKGCYGAVLTSNLGLCKHNNIPTDIFYACFEDDISKFNWDYNNNDTIGEYKDSINIYPSLYISRLPVESEYQVSTFIKKLLDYEQYRNNDGIMSLLLTGCNLGTVFFPASEGKSDAHQFSERMQNYCIDTDLSDWNGSITNFYDTGTSFAQGENYDVNKENLQIQLNNNYDFINILTHGSYNSLTLENYSIYGINDANMISNANNTILLSSSCYSNAFDYSINCLGESFILNRNGCIAYWGSTREGFIESSNIWSGSVGYSSYFFYNLFHNRDIDKRISSVMTVAKNSMYNDTSIRRWLHFSMNALGDPEMPIYTRTPSSFSNVSIINSGTNVIVSTGGIDSCTIALTSKDSGQSYFKVIHNTDSAVFLNVQHPFNLVITKHNYIPYQYERSNTYVQNRNIKQSTTINGHNIYVGYDVNPSTTRGNVNISTNATVVFDAVCDTFIKNGFNTQIGSLTIIK